MLQSMYQLSQRKVEVVMIGSIYQNQPVKDAITAYISDVPVVIINDF